MNALDMISEPLLFVEHLQEHSREVHHVVALIPLLVEAVRAADEDKAAHLRGQISETRENADRIRSALYSHFKDVHFRGGGGYAVGQYVGDLARIARSVEDFGEAIVLLKHPIPPEVTAELETFASQGVQVSGLLLSLEDTLWPGEEAVTTDQEAGKALRLAESVGEAIRCANRLGMAFLRHVYDLEEKLRPAAILQLDRCQAALAAVVNNAEDAASHLRLVIDT